MTQLVEINGHTWIYDAHVSEKTRRLADELCGSGPCKRCGAPNYAHHMNVIEHPTNCTRYEPKEPE